MCGICVLVARVCSADDHNKMGECSYDFMNVHIPLGTALDSSSYCGPWCSQSAMKAMALPVKSIFVNVSGCLLFTSHTVQRMNLSSRS